MNVYKKAEGRLKVYSIIKAGNKVRYLSTATVDDTARKTRIFNRQKINGWKDFILKIFSHNLRKPISMVSIPTEVSANKLPKAENNF